MTNTTTHTTTPRITGIRTVGVPVADQDRALAFYIETLGFEKRLDVPVGNGSGGSRSRQRAPR
jgi:lactoylglutathione lyase